MQPTEEKQNEVKGRDIINEDALFTLVFDKESKQSYGKLFKKAMLFISPESEEISKRIFASYDSCRRQTLKEEDKNTFCAKSIPVLTI